MCKKDCLKCGKPFIPTKSEEESKWEKELYDLVIRFGDAWYEGIEGCVGENEYDIFKEIFSFIKSEKEKSYAQAKADTLKEYKAELVKMIKNFRFSIPVGEGKFTTLICPDCKEQRFICKECITNLIISPNKE